MTLTLTNVLSIIALLVAVVGGALLKMFASRAFKTIDEEIQNLKRLYSKIHTAEKDIVRLQEQVKITEDLKNQINEVYDKIEHLHDKLDNKRK